VERFDGSFSWLAKAPLRTTHSDEEPDSGWAEKIASLRARGFNVPASFERLMLDVDLQLRVPSCTDNTFLSARRAEEHPLGDEHECFLTFYTDSQSCVLWGLRLAKGDRYAPVLAGAPEFPDEEPPADQPYFSFPELTFNAPTFEAFIYRWWLENVLWFATKDRWRRPLTAEEQAYLDHLART
jgi:hypothetical protein